MTVSLRPLEEQSQAMAEPGETIPKAVERLALVDTAASRTRVDQDAWSRADLNVMDRGSISFASHSAHSVPLFACEIEVAGLEKFPSPRGNGSHARESGIDRCNRTGCTAQQRFRLQRSHWTYFYLALRLCISIPCDLSRPRACDQNLKVSEAYPATVGPTASFRDPA